MSQISAEFVSKK